MQPRTRTYASVAALVLGCAVAVGVPLALRGGGSGPTPVATIGAGAPTRLAVPTTPAPISSSSTAPVPRAPRTSTTPAARLSSPPVRLTVSGVDISAPVVPVGVETDGTAEIPERVDTVGWYRFGPAPGAPAGSTVLMGHVDDRVQGEGAFFRLREVGAGSVVSVVTADGVTHRYRVVGRQQYPKSEVPLAAIFSRSGTPRLTLITCGGTFDRAARSYEDNVVVTAVPAG